MNCQQARKLLYAFGDGQLEVKENCELLDHLKMCPDCAHIVAEHQSLRGALRRGFDAIAVPAGLEQRVRDSLSQETEPAPVRSSGRNWRLLAPALLATAACAFFGISSVYRFFEDGWGDNLKFPPGIEVNRGVAAASEVAQKHLACCAHAGDHQDADLTNDLGQLGPAISRHYADRLVALAPDFSRYGLRLESASYCGVQTTECKRGGHLIYVSQDGATRLSFFSVPRWDCLDKCGERNTISDGLRSYTIAEESGPNLTVVCWHRDATTYICCSPLNRDLMLEMVNTVRLAPSPVASASIGS